jgi:surfactin synthase thioesterase subunit
MGGTPEAVLEHLELMSVLNPILRADLEVCQTYEYEPRPPLDCPITVFGGLQDEEVSREQLEAGATTQPRPSPFECSPGITSTCIQLRMSCCG